MQADDDTSIIRLPAEGHLEAAEERLKEVDYQLPTFYERVFRSKPAGRRQDEVSAERIADYTINGCVSTWKRLRNSGTLASGLTCVDAR